MKLIAFICVGVLLLITMPLLRSYAGFSETYLSGITGAEDWMVLVFTVAPIVLPIAIVAVIIMNVIKGKKRDE